MTFTVWVDQNKVEAEQLLRRLMLKPRVRGLDGQYYPATWGAVPFFRVNSIDGFFANFVIEMPVRKTGSRLDGGTFEPTAVMADNSGVGGIYTQCAPCPITFMSGYADHVFFAVAPMPSAYTVTREHDHDGLSAKGTIGGDAGPIKLGAEVNTPKNSDKTTVAGPRQTPVTVIRLVETRSQGAPIP